MPVEFVNRLRSNFQCRLGAGVADGDNFIVGHCRKRIGRGTTPAANRDRPDILIGGAKNDLALFFMLHPDFALGQPWGCNMPLAIPNGREDGIEIIINLVADLNAHRFCKLTCQINLITGRNSCAIAESSWRGDRQNNQLTIRANAFKSVRNWRFGRLGIEHGGHRINR